MKNFVKEVIYYNKEREYRVIQELDVETNEVLGYRCNIDVGLRDSDSGKITPINLEIKFGSDYTFERMDEELNEKIEECINKKLEERENNPDTELFQKNGKTFI